MRLIDAPRCPYCARVRITLAEKKIAYERVEIDLRNRPDWLIELNPPKGRVPVIDDDGFVLPESEVIMAYLEEAYPDKAILAADLRRRAKARLLLYRFDDLLGDDYYAFRRGEENDLAGKLENLKVGVCLYSDIAYVPWVIRARDLLGVELPPHLAEWLGKLEERPSIAAEVELVRGL